MQPVSTSSSGPLPHAIVAVDRFIQATRDSGYRDTVSAISELVDNSVQAGAEVVEIQVSRAVDSEDPLEVSIRDDGEGMDHASLRRAMRFGGSSRFDDRTGLGRYGMGLPNSSLSQARRVEVFSWREDGEVLQTYLDVDEIAGGQVYEVPVPQHVELPGGLPSPTGTIVQWTRCDRLDNRRATTVARKLMRGLGRKFRYFLWDGGRIVINGEEIVPIDPLYLREDSLVSGARAFGEVLEYEFRAPGERRTSLVSVRFSELPVESWHALSNEEKRRLGVPKGAGVSVVRAGREVDYGWFLMGGKRRENYDDWWRCEICFEPPLDEAFGITHTKQQIRPVQALQAELAPDLEQVARVLNQRARAAYQRARRRTDPVESETRAETREGELTPLSPPSRRLGRRALKRLADADRSLAAAPGPRDGGTVEYRLVEASGVAQDFYTVVHQEGRVVVVINPDHEFCRSVWRPLQDRTDADGRALRTQLELMLLAAARAELAVGAQHGPVIDQLRRAWSDALAAFLRR